MKKCKHVARLVLPLLLCAILFAGCSSQTYLDYDNSGYFTSPDGHLQLPYQKGFEQLASAKDPVLALDWEKEKINIQIGRVQKDSQQIIDEEVQNLTDFVHLYEQTDLDSIKKYATIGKLTEYSFEGFSSCLGYDLDAQRNGNKLGARLYYLEDENNYFVIFLNGEKEYYQKHFDLLDEMAHSIKVLP